MEDSEPKIGLTFDSEPAAYDFFCEYGGRLGFSVRRIYAHKGRKDKIMTSRKFVCSKEGVKKPDKRGSQVKNPRAETSLLPCTMGIKLDRRSGKYFVNIFDKTHNHPLVAREHAHMLPSRRKISETQAVEIDMAQDCGIDLRLAYELLSKEAGGRECVGFTKDDQKNYLQSRRQRMLAYGEAGSILKYFQEQALQNPSFFYAVQLDNEEQITNIFWADASMIIDYGQFGDVVSFDTTYKINRECRPFAVFTGFNHHRETVIFGAALMYDETADSFVWLFETFLKAMSNKHPKTIITDQDAAMAKAVSHVMPDTFHRLCVGHIMQNALKHCNSIFRGRGGVKAVLGKFIDDIEFEDDFVEAWDAMLVQYNVCDNKWLRNIFNLRHKWGRAYVRHAWSAGMSSTQLSESLNAALKKYLRSDHNLIQFFTHFERVLNDKRYNEAKAEYALSYKLPKFYDPIKNIPMIIQAGTVYTKNLFEEFQTEFCKVLAFHVVDRKEEDGCRLYTLQRNGESKRYVVRRSQDDHLTCICRLFEMRGILCSHAIKVLKDEMNLDEIPDQYILKRWTRNARCESVLDIHGHEILADPCLEQSNRYKLLCSMFRKLSCRAAETDETYKVCAEFVKNILQTVEDMLRSHVIDEDADGGPNSEDVTYLEKDTEFIPKGLKKKARTHRGRKRMKSSMEKSLLQRKKQHKDKVISHGQDYSPTPNTPESMQMASPQSLHYPSQLPDLSQAVQTKSFQPPSVGAPNDASRTLIPFPPLYASETVQMTTAHPSCGGSSSIMTSMPETWSNTHRPNGFQALLLGETYQSPIVFQPSQGENRMSLSQDDANLYQVQLRNEPSYTQLGDESIYAHRLETGMKKA